MTLSKKIHHFLNLPLLPTVNTVNGSRREALLIEISSFARIDAVTCPPQAQDMKETCHLQAQDRKGPFGRISITYSFS
uniref:Uncharacterized protein n=1 Tax=Oryza meridionalis TaxID=40149 RepID=A0A0E0DAF2_9ORYZ